MISSLSKLADRAFIVGFVVPTILGLIAATAVFPDAQWLKPFQAALTPGSTTKVDALAFFAVTVWVLAILLSMTNYIQYRILEGYLWPFSERSFKDGELDRYDAQMRRFEASHEPESSKLERAIRKSFPWRREDVMATPFGNAIRAFELYPYDVYKTQPIGTWLRLGAVMSKDNQGAVNDARANVDFLVNVAFIAFAFAIVALAEFVGAGAIQHKDEALTRLGMSATFGGVAYLAYRGAVSQIPTWGDLVKSAFDCYLPDLAKKLGYDLPESPAERAAFWDAFGQITTYADTDSLQAWVEAHPAPPKPPCCRGDPAPAAQQPLEQKEPGERANGDPDNEKGSLETT